jgi:hypothetical protein
METPSEILRRAALAKLKAEGGSPRPEAEAVDSEASLAEFPSEPFQCPACGQLLAPSCRVCVACKHSINPAEIARPREMAPAAAHAPGTEPKPEPVRFPWRIFFAVLGILLIVMEILVALLGEQKGPLVLQSAPFLAGVWVFFDAFRRGIPRPLRWALGTMLLLAIIFPWYLARRSKPQSPVPFVEAEVGPVVRLLLFALVIFFLASLIFYIVKGPQPATAPPPPPGSTRTVAIPKPGASLIAAGRRGVVEEGPLRGHVRPRRPVAQEEASAPSDAWQT